MNPALGVEASRPVELKPAREPARTAAALPAGRNPFLTRGNLAILGMFAAAIAGLYLLSLRNGPSSALADQMLVHAKVEAALSVLSAKPSALQVEQRSNARAIVGEFYAAAQQRQVPPGGLRSNPFVFQPIKPPDPVPEREANEAEPPKDETPIEQKQAMAVVQKLKLHMILTGSKPVALISGNLLSEGESIEGWTVHRIEPREVELVWQDQKYVLKMPK